MTATGPPPSTRGRIVGPDDIVDAALAIIRRAGVSELSMRGLAKNLGVTVGATYHYFRDKDELLAAVADRVVIEIVAVDDRAEAWKQRLMTLLVQQDHVLRAHLGVASFMVKQRNCTAAVRWCNAYLTVLLDAGFSPSQAAEAFAGISLYVNPAFLVEGDLSELDAMKFHPHPEGPVTREFPAYRRVEKHLASRTSSDIYIRGAARLIDDLETDLAKLNQRRSSRKRP